MISQEPQFVALVAVYRRRSESWWRLADTSHLDRRKWFRHIAVESGYCAAAPIVELAVGLAELAVGPAELVAERIDAGFPAESEPAEVEPLEVEPLEAESSEVESSEPAFHTLPAGRNLDSKAGLAGAVRATGPACLHSHDVVTGHFVYEALEVDSHSAARSSSNPTHNRRLYHSA